MVKATLVKNLKDEIIEYKVKGHANYDDYGQDIVCAAVSVLTQNTLISILEILALDENSINYRIDNKTGFIHVKLLDNIDIEKFENAQLLLKSLEIGLNSIVKSYPKHVTLNYEGV